MGSTRRDWERPVRDVGLQGFLDRALGVRSGLSSLARASGLGVGRALSSRRRWEAGWYLGSSDPGPAPGCHLSLCLVLGWCRCVLLESEFLGTTPAVYWNGSGEVNGCFLELSVTRR